MLKSNENMKMKMSGLGTAQSLVGRALSARHQDSDLHTLLSQGIERSNKGKQTMKKLMFTAAAALCATVGFADITSANIVGYSSTDAIFGAKAMGASFVPVAGGEYDLQEIKPVAPAEAGGVIDDWVYYIYEISAGGACDAEAYVYIDVANDSGVEKSGWYDANDGTTPIERTFKAGEGFAFSSDVEGAAMQSAGQVDVSEVVVPAVFGCKAMTNPFPVDHNIENIVPVPPEGSGIDDWVYYIYEISAGGACDAEAYVYIDVANDSGVEKSGWYDANDGTTPIERTFKPGEGFAFSSDVEGAGVAFEAHSL